MCPTRIGRKVLGVDAGALHKQSSRNQDGRSLIYLSLRQSTAILLVTIVFAFSAGGIFRIMLLANRRAERPRFCSRHTSSNENVHMTDAKASHTMHLLGPTVMAGKDMATATFSSIMIPQDSGNPSQTARLDCSSLGANESESVPNLTDSYVSQDYDALESLDQPAVTVSNEAKPYTASLHSAMYHEAFVHPAMMVHPSPKRVAIIGSDTGALLGEVLKYKTVEEVVMVKLNKDLLNPSKDHLSEWNVCCKDSEGSNTDSSFGDSRTTTVVVQDAFKWFKENNEDEKFDVIIMDAPVLPDEIVDTFADSLFNSLLQDGVVSLKCTSGLSNPLLLRTNLSACFHSSARVQSDGDCRIWYDTSLARRGLQEHAHLRRVGILILMFSYLTSASSNTVFLQFVRLNRSHRSFLVCLKNHEMRARWHRRPAELELDLHRRLRQTKSGEPILSHFDTATMMSYQLPSKLHEIKFCQSGNDDIVSLCKEFSGFNPSTVNIPLSHFEARKSGAGEFAGRGLYAIEDIPARSVFDINQSSVKSFHLPPSTMETIEVLYSWAEGNIEFVEYDISSIYTYVDGMYVEDYTLLLKFNLTCLTHQVHPTAFTLGNPRIRIRCWEESLGC